MHQLVFELSEIIFKADLYHDRHFYLILTLTLNLYNSGNGAE